MANVIKNSLVDLPVLQTYHGPATPFWVVQRKCLAVYVLKLLTKYVFADPYLSEQYYITLLYLYQI